ncbi:MAG: hypothetical protein GWN00_00515, partial [Aliifodinibius sp.]|nr:hypothetical protein [Fodinibius sp.]NIV09811.1 hypothetical protein [Fodinibius sp.]NIY23347.1 hypothetical protein [Fodinibius sp.]
NYPTSREYIDAAIGLSKSYGALDNYEKQFDILYGLIKENLVPSRVPEIYNIIAGFYEESAGISEQLTGAGTTDYQTAIEYYKKSIEYPNSNDMNAKGFAQYRIGRLHEDLENYQNAFEAYKTVATQYEGTEWAVRADQSIDELSATLQRRKEYQEKGLLPDTTTKASTAPVSSEPEMPIE